MHLQELTMDECRNFALKTAFYIVERLGGRQKAANSCAGRTIKLFPIPRGGTVPAYLVAECLEKWSIRCEVVFDPVTADFFIDDIIATGGTKEKYTTEYPDIPFYALITRVASDDSAWYVFPWETDEQNGPENNIVRILEFIGEDPKREGLRETPARVIKSYGELFSGYNRDPDKLFTVFEESSDEMVLLRNIEFYSHCEHHMMPFFGHASIAYLPDKRVIGVSKIARLLEVFARRLQIQERLTSQITEALNSPLLAPRGTACVITAKHFCMTCRGASKQSSEMVTSSLTGVFKEPTVRAEFFALVQGK